ncbi:hypothetical protein X975_21705, partial [Stegodyphus mimosarum]
MYSPGLLIAPSSSTISLLLVSFAFTNFASVSDADIILWIHPISIASMSTDSV